MYRPEGSIDPRSPLRRAATCSALAICLALPLAASDAEAPAEPTRDAQAVEIFEKADAALKKIGAVAFESSIEPSGSATYFVQPAKGKGVMAGWTGQIPERFHVVVSTGKGDGARRLEGGGNGDTYFLIDHGTQKGYEDMDPGVLGSDAATLQNIAMVEYVHESPFDDEIGAETLRYEGKETVDGVSCHEIEVAYTGGRGSSTWYLGEEDHLPRRRVRHFRTPQGEGEVDIRFRVLEINPEIDDSRFVMKLPEGYEQVDDFAP